MNILTNSWFLLGILLWHWFLDFIIQRDIDARNKWRSDQHLNNHLLTYSLGWFIMLWPFFGSDIALGFTVITALVHGPTDWITSRISHYYFVREKYKQGFITVGFDQILHYVQLYLTFKLLL